MNESRHFDVYCCTSFAPFVNRNEHLAEYFAPRASLPWVLTLRKRLAFISYLLCEGDNSFDTDATAASSSNWPSSLISV
jgi:hypothetical protein